MTRTSQAADPLTHPLTGQSLVESSAGTGKTTMLVRLYLRALLLDGRMLSEILAVTYTRAATGELSVRIRKGLLEAGKNLASPTGFWADFFADADKDQVRKRIDAALAGFDDKGVFTIHGFCQRMLSDHAFEARSAFASEEIEDESGLREEVAADFWRHRVARDDPAYVRWFVATFASPRELLRGPLRQPLQVSGELTIKPTVSESDVEAARERFEQAARTARDGWRKDAKTLRAWIGESDDLDRGKYPKTTTARMLDDWARWLEAPPALKLPENFDRLTREKASQCLKRGAVPETAFFNRDCAAKLLAARDGLHAAWWQETVRAAFAYVRREFSERKKAQRERGFDDMLRELHDALREACLARRIAKQFPLILVDEFQDTDPLQYAIFKRIHAAAKEAHGLVLIGDPKQAIYRFRGADIATYLEAKRECDGSVYRLEKNYRSAEPLLTAVNALFDRAHEPFEFEEIPYDPVTTGREPPIAPLSLATNDDAPTTVVRDARKTSPNKKQAAYRATRIAAEEIARLLALGERGEATLDGERLQAGDIGVLVNSNHEGLLMQAALRGHGVASAMVATQSVFVTEEADELHCLLAAIAEPTDGKRLRRALATRLLGRTAGEIAAWREDETAWADEVSRFREYHERWQNEGVEAMLARLFRREGVIERTLARDDGARAMTNLRQLIELAGEEAERRPGMAPLLAWLGAEREEDAGAEARQLRLESDADLVRIATLHKAKGLQYPVVFLPFLWEGRNPKQAQNTLLLAHEGDATVLDLGSPGAEKHAEDAARDDHSEAARKTYVALTRAVRACYIIAIPTKTCVHSALCRLLGVDEVETFHAGLNAWAAAAGPSTTVRAPLQAPLKAVSEASATGGRARVFQYTERLRQRFHVASYSMLVAGASGGAAERPEHDQAVVMLPTEAAAPATGIHAFPAGPQSGVLLHELLENLSFGAGRNTIAETAQALLSKCGFDAERWTRPLADWVSGVLATPLQGAGCRLADIGAAQRVDEMEFHFRLNTIEARELEAAIAEFAPAASGPELRFAPVRGQMKGYMDLVFEHAGRYWVADYKSNRLGETLDAYTPAALDEAMAEHRYDLQYLIYTVALHRYLAARIRDYDYERHIGGVVYFFLRGMAPQAPDPRGVWHTRPDKAAVERLDQLLAGGSSAD